MLGSMYPYGYRFMPKADGKPAGWEIEPRETEIVRLIFDLYVNKGIKGTQIAEYLESEGVQTRSGTTKWWCSVVYRILKSEAYIGNAYMYKNSYVEPLKTPKSKKYRKVKNQFLSDGGLRQAFRASKSFMCLFVGNLFMFASFNWYST